LPPIKGSDTESKDSIQERISSVNRKKKKGKFSPEAGTRNYVAGTGTAPPHIAEQNQQRLFWNTAICRTSFVVDHTALFLIRPNSESP
jgi:hypothetical protein